MIYLFVHSLNFVILDSSTYVTKGMRSSSAALSALAQFTGEIYFVFSLHAFVPCIYFLLPLALQFFALKN